jgi:hypothetical protein
MSHETGSPSEGVSTTPPSLDERPIEHPPIDRKISFSIMGVFIALGFAAVLLGGDLLNPASSTTDGDFEGETVEMLIPLAEGGGTDTWARFVGEERPRPTAPRCW